MGRKKSTGAIETKETKVKREIPSVHTEGLPYYEDIRASWVANQRHCDPDSPDRRETFIKNGITFCPEWLGELGWLRYYIFHMDSGYIKGKSKLIRSNKNKGFSAENCIVVDKEVKKKKEVSDKTEKKENKDNIVETSTPSIVNNFIIASNDMKNLQDIIKSVNLINNRTLTEDDNKIIYLNSMENQTEQHTKCKN
ncbi:hypothetical protein [Anaerovorax odorimutans]|uniref:hypothetical protein n=1 Tax=Anaerovorax odorimutans TaxID=109327 RepID=UPI0004184AFC|nr:hypothetical protein [Anaerovorax odorimutans]